MITIRNGRQYYKLIENSPQLPLLQNVIDAQSKTPKKFKRPAISRGPACKRNYPAAKYVSQLNTQGYVAMYFKLNRSRFWVSDATTKYIYADLATFFQTMRDGPIPTLQGLDGIESPLIDDLV